jgi:N-formylglutamate amidohydrolase
MRLWPMRWPRRGVSSGRRSCSTAIPCRALEGQPGTPIIFGDRYGTTISPELRSVALAAARMLGFAASCNDPYAGGHVIERHGRPGEGIHALQLEIDRSFYLDAGAARGGRRLRPGRAADRAGQRAAGRRRHRGDALPIAAE